MISRRSLILAASAAIMMFSVCAVIYSVRAELSHVFYYKIRYATGGNPDIFADAGRAHALYPWNFRLAACVAGIAFQKRFDNEGREIAGMMEIADQWCSMGLKLNRHERQLLLLNTMLIQHKSLNDAVAYWEEYVSKTFWDPRNHLVLVELYTRLRNVEKAEEALKWSAGASGYKNAEMMVDDLRKNTPAPSGDSR